MSNPTDITATILREMREEMRQGFKAMEQRFDKLEARVETLENGMHGVQVVLVNAIGMFDQRISAVEAKVN